MDKNGILFEIINEGSYFPNFETVVTADVTLRGGEVIKSGTPVRIDFNTERESSIRVITSDHRFMFPVELAHRYLEGFVKPPKMRELQRWSERGTFLSVIGNKVERNGYGPNGDPCWMIVFDMNRPPLR